VFHSGGRTASSSGQDARAPFLGRFGEASLPCIICVFRAIQCTKSNEIQESFGFSFIDARKLGEFAAAHLVPLPGDGNAFRIQDPFHRPIMRVIFAVTSADFAMFLHLDNNVMNMVFRLLFITAETADAPNDNEPDNTNDKKEK
jgi:hypothetical protein